MEKILQEILQIDSSRECIKFLVKRVQSDNYRGLQISQHNRYTQKEILIILQEIYEICGEELLQIRTTDLSKRPYNIKGEEKYALLTTKIATELGRCTQDSLRKNIFVDLHRMGLIDRFNAKKKKLNAFDGGVKKYIALTPFGIEFLQNTNIFTQNLLFTRALENLMSGFGEELLNIMLELESDYLTIYEMLFFATFLYQNLDSKNYSRSDIVELIKDYRTLSKFQKQALIEKVKLYCEPTNFSDDKTQKRDFHNWINETQQILSLLSQMAYFEYNKHNFKLCIRTGDYGIYENNTKLKRSIKEKYLYFEKHSVTKEKGFELHHIVPLCLALNRAEFQVLDKWENMVYIDAFSHAKITQNNNKNMRLNFNGDNAEFSDFSNNIVHCENHKNIKYDTKKQELMLDYNKSILDSGLNF
ncbi:MAG: restriction endonuclease subunit R [Helicobacter sp.]|nr:restriction endonuclease subunit R [Helicobacter sp.]